MALRDILLYPHKTLGQKAAPVEAVDDELRGLIDDMAETMYAAPGIGLAAPQVGVLQRVTVIDVSSEERPEEGLRVFVNPQIVSGEGQILWEEGCLSMPGVYDKVERAERVVVRSLDRNGDPQEVEASGLLAVALQHEIDHLDGIMFIEHLSPIRRRMVLKKYRKKLDEKLKKKKDGGEP